MKTFYQRGFLEDIRELLEHIDHTICIHGILRDIAAENYTGICRILMIGNGVDSLFQISFECSAHLIHIRK